jgi:hypothetical protein
VISDYERVKDIILGHRGKQNAITGAAIASSIGHRDDRVIREIIRELIAGGWPIAASVKGQQGYFLCETLLEAQEYQDSLKSRLIHDALRRRDFKRAFHRQLAGATQKRML